MSLWESARSKRIAFSNTGDRLAYYVCLGVGWTQQQIGHQWVVDAQSVTHFQKMLTAEAREQCRQGNASWVSSFSKRGGSPDLNGPSIDMLSQADDF